MSVQKHRGPGAIRRTGPLNVVGSVGVAWLARNSATAAVMPDGLGSSMSPGGLAIVRTVATDVTAGGIHGEAAVGPRWLHRPHLSGCRTDDTL